VILVTPLLLEICNRSWRSLVKVKHINVLGVSPPEEKGLEKLPDLPVPPMFTENISWILVAFNVIKTDDGQQWLLECDGKTVHCVACGA